MESSRRRGLNLPLEFISFAFIEGKMFTHQRYQGTFVVPSNKRWGNTVVYGAIFLLRDYYFYIRTLDAYFACSKSALRKNHNNDLHHRHSISATPISFRTLDQFSRLQYTENEVINVQSYFGNTKHSKIKQRIQARISYRIVDGLDKTNFTKLFMEVSE